MTQESATPAKEDQADEVGRHYDHIWEMEATRLETWSPGEYAMTLRYLRRHVPDGAIVAEIGVGVGHYSEALACRGCTLHLVDVSRKLLDATVARLAGRGLAGHIASVTHGSACDLSFLPSGSSDVVLFLGPLYHLTELADRRAAVAEAARVLKPGGVLFAVGINRLSYLRDMFRRYNICALLRLVSQANSSRFLLSRLRWLIGARKLITGMQELLRRDLRAGKTQEFLATGRLDPEHAPPIGYAHMTTLDEFRDLFTGFEQVALVGLESFTAPAPHELNDKPEDERELWLDLIEQTGSTPEGLGYSDHFLFIGRRR